jgi:tetratricopeptide (TPR) repeat protein
LYERYLAGILKDAGMKQKIKKNALLIVKLLILCVFIFSCSLSSNKEDFSYNENIKKYEKLLLKEPDNCFYLQQVASSYQALNDFDKAISFYKRTKDNCRDNLHLLNKFQMGVCYYLIMDRDNGIRYMNEAIDGAEKSSDSELYEMFKREKIFWLGRWDSIQELEWNKTNGLPTKRLVNEKNGLGSGRAK